MSKQFLGVIAAIFVVFAAIFVSSSNHNKTGTGATSSVKPTEHIQGNTASSVKLVEYGDFQCPYCEAYEPTVESVVATYKDRVAFQFRNFPLVNNHPNAFAAARSAEAAGLQGKYWEMHNFLYSAANWQSWTNTTTPNTYFDSYAQQLGLDVAKFKTDYASETVNNLINADMKAGTDLQISGTPSFFLDGKQVQIANTVEAFSKVIDAELAKVKPATASTTTQ
jgi:protein-disulfide isomerase